MDFAGTRPLLFALALAILPAGPAGGSGDPPPTPSAPTAGPTDFRAAARRVGAGFVDLDIVGRDGRRRFAAGFALRAGDRVVTAEHAIANARRITAHLPDGRRLDALPVAADALADVAVLRLPAEARLAPVALGAPPEPGRPVAALGNPLGYGRSLSLGIVSTTDRAGSADSPYDLLQHDAALNPGSSGGPLFDATGAVVGMNVAIPDGARRDVGIGLAVPIETVVAIADRLVSDGGLPRPRLGLRLRDAAALRDAIPGLVGEGVVVENVDPGSAAARAGLEAGRLIVAAQGRPVRTTRDLARALEPLAPGDRFRLVTLEGDTAETREFVLDGADRRDARPLDPETPPPRFGLAFAPDGATVSQVVADTPADLAGLRPGDRLRAVGLRRIDVAHPAGPALDAAVAEAQTGGGTALLVERDGATRWLIVDGTGRLDTMAPFGSNSEAAGSIVL